MIKLLIVLFVLLLLVLLAVGIQSKSEYKKIKKTEYEIELRHLPSEFHGYKIMFMADMHNCFHSQERIIEFAAKEKPDIIILGGDMVVYNEDKICDIQKMAEFINKLSNYGSTYYAPGNHELGYVVKGNPDIWHEYIDRITGADNIFYLENHSVNITKGNSGIKIYGLDLRDGYYKRFVKKKLTNDTMVDLLGRKSKDEFAVLIAHNPDYFSSYAKWGADLVFSGHNHGGLVNVPVLGGVLSPRLRIFPRYDKGVFKKQESVMILTSGLGGHTVKIRVNNLPEIVLVKLKCK